MTKKPARPRKRRAPVTNKHGVFVRRASQDISLLSDEITQATLLYSQLEGHFALPKVVLPDLSSYAPEEAARYILAHWGEDTLRKKNLIGWLETMGVRFGALTGEHEFKTVSVRTEENILILVSPDAVPVEARALIAMELGYQLARTDAKQPKWQLEDWAEAFALELLVPGIEAELYLRDQDWDIETLQRMVRDFGVTWRMVIKQVFQLGYSSFDGYFDLQLYYDEPAAEAEAKVTRGRSQLLIEAGQYAWRKYQKDLGALCDHAELGQDAVWALTQNLGQTQQH